MFDPKVQLFQLVNWFVNLILADKHGSKNLYIGNYLSLTDSKHRTLSLYNKMLSFSRASIAYLHVIPITPTRALVLT